MQPYKDIAPYTGTTFDLPSILVPPEVVELDTLSTESGEDALVKKEEWPEFYVRLFDSDVRLTGTHIPTLPKSLTLFCLGDSGSYNSHWLRRTVCSPGYG